MKTVWDRIHAWLAANAPPGYGDLRPGAAVEAVRAAEVTLGLTLPDDVVTSYLIHDGQETSARYGRGLVGGEGWRLLPLTEVLGLWREWTATDPADARFVPIADLGTGDCVFLNLELDFRKLDPDAEEPGYLMIQRRDTAAPYAWMPTYSCWLEEFADELGRGQFAYSERHGSVMYADEIDLG